MSSNSSIKQIERTTLVMYIIAHMNWSRETFGEGDHFEGLMKHIEKEMIEAREVYFHDGPMGIKSRKDLLMELVDIIILTIDAMWRLGFNQFHIIEALIDKQNINKKRRYPKITDPSQPTEHIREEGGD